MFAHLIALLFPKYCFGCKQQGNYLCANCAAGIRLPGTLENPQTFACFGYRHTLAQDLIWKLKYQRHQSIAEDLAPYLYERILEEIADYDQIAYRQEKILLIPVPLFRDRQKKRGFNQAERLTRALTKQDPSLFEHQPKVLKKTRSTATQVSQKNRSARLHNLAGAFAINNPDIIKNRIVIIVDDIITTGATMDEIRKTLEQAGAKIVFGLAVAHG